MRRRSGGGLVGALLVVGALTACTASPGVESPSPGVPSATPDAAHYPDGATADTPECQDASPATIAAVNATIANPNPDEGADVSWLTARADPENAVWMLTGLIASPGTEDGYLVVWATTADPTADSFDGALRSVGSTTATISSAPAQQFASAAPGGFPPSALACAAAHGS